MPYKVVFVEDEVVTREGIRDHVDWAGLGFELCGEASDGEMALQLLQTTASITGAKKTAEWTTEVITPKDVKGLFILESVETKQQRWFSNFAVDITNK